MTTTSSMRGWMAVAVGMWLWPLPARRRAHPRGRRAPAAERTASRERRSPSAVMVGELVGGEASVLLAHAWLRRRSRLPLPQKLLRE